MESKMQIEYLSPGALIPSPHNARIHPPEQIQAIADNIRENGFLRPVLIDGENGIIGGHGGVEAAKLLELPEIPCVRADHLTEAQVRAYMLADNRLAEMSYYDMEAVSKELEALSEMGFDLALTGFDLTEVQEEAERLERELRRKECPTSLKDVFVVPPFSVLDTRQGYWQDRKKIKALKDTAEYARMMYRLGAITREEAAERIKPYADAFNAKSKEIAKKYHQKPGRFSLAAYLR